MNNTIIIKNEMWRDWLENYECLGVWSDDDKAYFENEADFNSSFAGEIRYAEISNY